MLLEFKTKNYKSFVEETVFSLVPAPKQKGLDYSLQLEKTRNRNIKAVCSAVIYGPNAAGKTNIIGAMDTFRAIVLRGNIRNSEEKSLPNMAASTLELIPNNNADISEPVMLSVEFFDNGMLVKYSISMDLGLFLDSDYSRQVLSEELIVNGEIVFTRDGEDLFMPVKKGKADSLLRVSDGEEKTYTIAQNSLNDEELFLTNGFKLIFDQELVKTITNWFANKFMVVCRADSIQLIQRFIDSKKQTIYVEKTTNNAAKLFGINSNMLGYLTSDDDDDAKLFSVFNGVKNKKNAVIAAEIFESYGTIRFMNIFPLVIKAMLTGATLVVDEFDASIHPMALMNIINIFHNDDVNIHHAQLVFNTHNPIFLNSNLFRRDEIKFVERDDSNYKSKLYSLSDFGTSGEKGVRRHEDYMKNYFISQYGAIKDVDFTPIFEELIAMEKGV